MQEQYPQNPYQNGCEQPPQGELAPKNKGERVLKAIGAVALGAACFVAGGFAHYFSLDSELRALIQLKSRMQNSYYQEITDKQFYDAAFNGVNGLLDAYSYYLTADELLERQKQATGEKSGLGVAFSATATGDEELKIAQVSGNSPAERAGVKAGERIVGYGKTENELQTATTYQALVDFLRGCATGETLCLKLQSPNGQMRVVSLAKEEFLEGCVSYRTKDSAYRFVKGMELEKIVYGDALTVLNNDTAYISLSSFNGVAAEEFAMAMEQFQEDGKTNLVLDLRFNTGGYLDIMRDIASYFCKNATERFPVAIVADYGERKESYCAFGNCYDEYFTAESRITVLADNHTASASECLIGCMYDYGTIDYGDICLSQRDGVAKTYGKGIMQTTYPFITAPGAVKLTTATVHWPVSNRCIHGRGILPEDGALQVAENADFEAELHQAVKTLFP